MAAKHGSSDEQLSKMVRQLSFLGKLRCESEFVMLPGRKMDERIIKAFDVVMELSDGCLGFLSPGASPFTLLFTVQKSNAPPSNKVFGVVNVDRYSENIINAQLNAGDRDMTVIFILRDKEQKHLLAAKCNYYFAVQDESGKYKFLKTADKPRK
jgi:hypothetical protein